MSEHAPSAPPSRITVCGSFGFGNAGDEAVPLAVADLLEYLGLPVGIDVLSRFDAPAMPEVIGLGPDHASRRRQLAGQPLLFCGGGIVEARDMAGFMRCASLLDEVDVPTVSVFAAAAEPGVRFGLMMRRRTKRLLARMDHVSARDVLSAAVMQAIAPSISVQTLGDIALWMRPASTLPPRVDELPRYVAVSLASKWRGDPGWYDWLADQLVLLARELDAALVFIPCAADHDHDVDEHAEIARRVQMIDASLPIVQITGQLGPREVAAVLGGSRVTIGMRLHACVFAYAARTPFLGLAYHPKLQGFALTIGQPWAVLPSGDPSQQSPHTYGYAFADTGLVGLDLRQAATQAIENAGFERLDELRSSIAGQFRRVIGIH